MRALLLLLLAVFCMATNAFAQRTETESFQTRQGNTITYSIFSYQPLSISNAFIFTAADSAEFAELQSLINSCTYFKEHQSQVYLALLPAGGHTQDEYVQLVQHILSRRKMIDTKLFLIDDRALTSEYLELADGGKAKKVEDILDAGQVRDSLCK